MENKPPEQLDWLADEDKKADDDERSRLEMTYGEGARSAPLSEKERKDLKKEKESKRTGMLAELKKKLSKKTAAPN